MDAALLPRKVFCAQRVVSPYARHRTIKVVETDFHILELELHLRSQADDIGT